MTCYDLRFPEVGRTLADAGADVFLVPAEWVRGPLKEHHWRTLVHARAIENTVFVAAADHPPPLGVGNSMIVDPQGVEIAAIGTATDVVVAHLDRDDGRARASRQSGAAAAADAGRAARLKRSRTSGGERSEPGCRLFEHRHTLAGREAHERRVLRRGESVLTKAVSGMATTPARSGSARQNSAASVAPRGAASTTVKYEPAGTETSKPAARSPAPSRSRLSRRVCAMPVKNASGSRSPVAIAGWNGAPFT